MQRIRTLITVPEMEQYKRLVDEIAGVSPRLTVDVHVCKSNDEVAHILDDVEILYTQNVPAHLERAERLRWVQLAFTGVDNRVANPIFDPDCGIVVTNGAGAHAVSIAEYCLSVMVLLARNFLQFFRDQQARIRDRSHATRIDLSGATLGIIGYGHIGSEVGRLAAAHNMRILAVDRPPAERRNTGHQWLGVGDPEGLLPERFFDPAQLHDALKECDFVVCCVPLTPQTRDLFGEREFEIMKPGAYFIGVGRGGTVDDMALARALQRGEIAAAAMDVLSSDPDALPGDHPLWGLDNVFISPHVSGNRNDLYFRKMNDMFCENLRRYLKGEALLNVVTRERGY